jgi:two-component system OmpR family sensor kinase
VRNLARAGRHLGERFSSAFDRLPIRTRLASVSALLTFVILCAFALVVGSETVHRIRSDFNRDVSAAATNLATLLQVGGTGNVAEGFRVHVVSPDLNKYAASEHAAIRVLTEAGGVLATTKGAPNFGLVNETNERGYRVESRVVALGGPSGGAVVVQYARPLSEVEATVHRVELLLLLGVLAGAGLALVAGATIARRAMQPIAELTRTAAEITRTGDPSLTVAEPLADDEVAELARTLKGMLRSLEEAHGETEAMLSRQRQFVADASHELRTPLTSVLANLELLAESLHGEEGEAASSALRSSRRMRRLVADLLLLARTDVGRVVPREPVDLARVVVEATAELGPVSADHEISLDVSPAVIEAARDELFRLILNLLENALRHTPPGSEIWVSTRLQPSAGPDKAQAVLIVEDNGPGVSPELAASLFERFVRGAGDRGGSFGLGLAIVRAVAESHGGSVTLESTHRKDVRDGARFVVRLPAASDLDDDGQHHRPAAQAVVN